MRNKIRQYLEEQGIDYRTEGKNVSEGTIAEIKCPFCSDPSFHCGIFEYRDSIIFSCWRCKESGSLYKLLRELTNISWKEYQSFFEQPILEENVKMKVKSILNKNQLNRDETGRLYANFPNHSARVSQMRRNILLKKFMKQRRLNLSVLERYGVRLCRHGKYVHHLIIPIYEDEQMKGFVAKNIAEKIVSKYSYPSGFKIHDYVYGLDEVRRILGVVEEVVIVEGVFDVWRLRLWGISAVAVFGTFLSFPQKRKIVDLGVKSIVVAFDGDAYEKAVEVGNFFISFVESVKVLRLPVYSDPDSMEKRDFVDLMKRTDSLI